MYDPRIHDEYIAGYRNFLREDSLNLLPFVRLVDSLGRVPDERDLHGGFYDSFILVVHSSKFDYPYPIDSLYDRGGDAAPVLLRLVQETRKRILQNARPVPLHQSESVADQSTRFHRGPSR